MIRFGLKGCHKVTIFWCEKGIHALKITEKGRMWGILLSSRNKSLPLQPILRGCPDNYGAENTPL